MGHWKMEISIKILSSILALILFASCSTETNEEFIDSIDIRIKNNDYAYYVDFIYDFSKANRLNVMWFGYYNVENPQHWFERSGKTTFKMKAYILSEENGYLFASELFEDGMVELLINCGNGKAQWFKTLSRLEAELKADEQFTFSRDFTIDCRDAAP